MPRPRMIQKPRIETIDMPAPIGGINTISPGNTMPASDCIYLYNMIAAEYGLRSRLGYREWATGLTGASDNTVRTVIPFSGSFSDGSTDRLFVSTQSGIWDVSSQAILPSQWQPSTLYAINDEVINFGNIYICTVGGTSAVSGGPSGTGTGIIDGTVTWDFVSTVQPIIFGIQIGDAGFGISHVCATPAGRFLLYCDEENGLYVYRENTSDWIKVVSGTTELWQGSTQYFVGNRIVNNARVYVCVVSGISAVSGGPTGTGTGIIDGTVTWDYVEGPWQPLTAYVIGNRVYNGGNVYICTVAGTSAGAGGPTGTGTGIIDGTVTWDFVSSASFIGPSLADQQAGLTADPAAFVHVTVWKNRVWFTERNTSRGWYLGINSVFGTATSFDFGLKMRTGGPLVGLYNWSYDGGNGMETYLVGVSTSGDIIIYKGTDPTSIDTFGLVGCWYVGGVPYGRRIITEYGGREILIMSLLGVLPLSKLIEGGSVDDHNLYATGKISNLFNREASTKQFSRGWALHIHPTDNALLISIPQSEGQPTTQLAMAFAPVHSWSVYRDLPLFSSGTWNGQLYFGTNDGRVCINDGYVDAVLLSNPSSFAPVEYSFLTSYQSLGVPTQKQVLMKRPTIQAENPSPTVEVTARYNWDLTEPPPPSGSAGIQGASLWDFAIWDASIWGGQYIPFQPLTGSSGIGRQVAFAVRGTAITRTVFVSLDIYFRQGGIL